MLQPNGGRRGLHLFVSSNLTTLELLDYYSKLLILQYVGLPRAFETINTTVKPIIMPQQSQQVINFSPVPTSGTFVLQYGGQSTSTLHWNDSAGTIQTALRLLTGLSAVLVSGSIAGDLTIDFVGVIDVADLLEVGSNALLSGSDVVEPTVTETDQTLPIAVQNAFDPETAVGVQLDVIGKYQGVVRTGNSFAGAPISLSDADFRVLIQFAIIRNNAGSSLATIQSLLQQFFADEIFVFDYENMHMSYLVDSNLGSQDLIQLVISEGLLPKPMGVQLATTIYTPDLKFFGMLSAPVVKAYADQHSLTINQAADALRVANDIWQFNSAATPILGQWVSAAQGV